MIDEECILILPSLYEDFIVRGRTIAFGQNYPFGSKSKSPIELRNARKSVLTPENRRSTMAYTPPSKEQLKQWDAEDPLAWARKEYEIPSARACGAETGESRRMQLICRLVLKADGDAIYFCGNSLGLLAKRARKHVMEELDVWSSSQVPPIRSRADRKEESRVISPILTNGHGSISKIRSHLTLLDWLARKSRKWRIIRS